MYYLLWCQIIEILFESSHLENAEHSPESPVVNGCDNWKEIAKDILTIQQKQSNVLIVDGNLKHVSQARRKLGLFFKKNDALVLSI